MVLLCSMQGDKQTETREIKDKRTSDHSLPFPKRRRSQDIIASSPEEHPPELTKLPGEKKEKNTNGNGSPQEERELITTTTVTTTTTANKPAASIVPYIPRGSINEEQMRFFMSVKDDNLSLSISFIFEFISNSLIIFFV